MLRGAWRAWAMCILGGLLCISCVEVGSEDSPSDFDAAAVTWSRQILQGGATSAIPMYGKWKSPFQSAKIYASKFGSNYFSVSSSDAVKSSPKSSKRITYDHVQGSSVLYAKPPLDSLPPEEKSLSATPGAVRAAPYFCPLENSAENFAPTSGSSSTFQLPLPVARQQISTQMHYRRSLKLESSESPPPVQQESYLSVPAPAEELSISSSLHISRSAGLAPLTPSFGFGKLISTPSLSPATFFPTPLPSPSESPEVPASPDAPTMDSPLTSPSSGCCGTDMMPRPGLPVDSCMCVYPIRLELLVFNVSTSFTNWSAEFQQELASQLNLSAIQIEITSFLFNGSNLSLFIEIGPLINDSFSQQQADMIKTDLESFKVHLNSSLFGNYTLERFRHFEAPASTPSVPSALPAPAPSFVAQMLPQPTPSGKDKISKPSLDLIIGIIAGITVLVLLLGITIWKCTALQRLQKDKRGGKGTSLKGELKPLNAGFSDEPFPWPTTTRLFSYEELSEATNNFHEASVLGEGGFGRVYKGILKDGTLVAIKRLIDGGHQGCREFLVEVEMLSRLHHRNLVKLVGYYTSHESFQHLLCYELVPNGSLEAWLHGPLGANNPLDWNKRLKIALDAARGLAYLHEDSQPCVIHRDFKASNILLENNFHAKVADFGLAKQAPEGQSNHLSTRVMGTFGYVAPEYAMTGHLLVKSDVYSYGVVLLELLVGRKPVDMSRPSGQENLVTWARPILRDKERLGELVDPRLSGNYPKEDFAQVAAIASACVAPEASQRPTMGEVVQSLKMVQQSSECALSGETREYSTETEVLTSMSNRHSTTCWQNTKQISTAFESDDSSSIFSSGPLSGLTGLDDNLSRTAVFSEDLQEGR